MIDTKKTISVTINLEAYLELKKQQVNISGLISDFLVKYTNVSKPELKGSNAREKLEEAKLQRFYLEKQIEDLKKAEVKEQEAKYGKVRKVIF